MIDRDFDQIHASRNLRVLMTNSSASYYVLRGQEYGFEFELADQIARELDVHLQVVLPDAARTPIEMLQAGLVDIIAMPLLPEQRQTADIALTVPYQSVQQRLVVHRDHAETIQRLSDLDGLKIATRQFSSGERELARLRRLGVNLYAVLYGPEVPQEAILDLVADGTYPAAIALDVEIEAAQRFRKELYKSVALGPLKDVRWAVRSNSPQLLAALDQVLSRHVRRNRDDNLVRSEFYNVIHKRYFDDTPRMERHQSDPFLLGRTGRVSPYDNLFRSAARESGLDWRLLAALSFQESRFDPDAVSWAGAYGLMQLCPRTAGVAAENLTDDPALNVALGAQHLRMLYDHYDGIAEPDRTRFALAAYNCGQGHLGDARTLAGTLGHDPDVWEGSVREALLLLRQPSYHRTVRYGYVRGNETVGYVREVEKRFALLKHMVSRSLQARVALSEVDNTDASISRASATSAPGLD
jgi:membrane-bound lytic murein transglycosylase F